jgi:hypothetical protein
VRKTFLLVKPAALAPVLLSGLLCGCNPALPGAPYALSPRLPYAACGDMADLRTNLTGNSDLSPQSDAIMRSLGVRCLGEGPIPYSATALRARY